MSPVDFESAILAARFCDGGHAVNGEDSERLPLTLPEPKPPSVFQRIVAAVRQRIERFGRI